jgi:hypothetical protein
MERKEAGVQKLKSGRSDRGRLQAGRQAGRLHICRSAEPICLSGSEIT